jgi:pimeloyl-ACP methyl ester carboxylesterase
MEQSEFVEQGNAKFHYRVFGSGPQLLFCFHGYGRDSYSFGCLQKALGNTYTLIAIDMPFHGLTAWKNKLTFHPNYLVQVMQQIRKKYNSDKEKFSVLGFSMGGRIALHLVQVLHKHIDRVVLIAPDGLKINFWHWFCTHTWPGNKLLGYTINHPSWVLYLLKLAERTRVINASVASFVHYYLHDHEQRQTLYQRWTTLRKFTLNIDRLKKTIIKNKIPVRMLFGLHDQIILSSSGRKFRRGIEEYATVKVINETHYLLREAHAQTIKQLFTP